MARRLTDYEKKRDFTRTPEPAPSRAPDDAGNRFVVHRHEATRLHYDLRLEVDGALRSWAVPRGFSYVPGQKRLAVETEDHPLEYLEFEGVIPAGQYGAGTIAIWDRGRYELTGGGKDLAEGIRAGKLEVRLRGKRLRGEWHLVRTKRGERDWLMFKARDRYARSEEDPAFPFAIDLDAARRRPCPRRLKPMRPAADGEPFSDPQWLFEVEFDGLRVLAIKRGDSVELLRASTGRRLGVALPEIEESLRAIRAEDAVIDGALVVLDSNQRPSRALLDDALDGSAASTIMLQAFDLVHFDEWRLARLPLADRKSLLRSVLPGSGRVVYVDHVVGEGERLCDVLATAGLPAAIAKRASSGYRAGASRDWVRVPVEGDGRAELPVSDLVARARRRSSRFGRVRYTNRDKVYFPERGFTKGDLLDYYERVAEYLLPYLHDRPLHLRRCPDGIHGEAFYQHNAPAPVPDWVRTVEIDHGQGKTVRSIVCNDRETLLWVINLGSIDLHPWLSRVGALDSPDLLVLDLDPDGSPPANVVRVARAIGKLLRGIGLRPAIKTSGASGIHVTVPLIASYTYEQGRMFAEAIARKVAHDHDDIATTERSLARRRGRVYIDFMQNRRGQTVVPPYVVRPVEAASVSTPLDWDELAGDLDFAAFDITTVPERLARLGDLHRSALDDPQDLLPAIESFGERFGDRG